MAATHALYDVDPFAITICKKGANGQTIFLRKEHPEPDVTLPAPAGIFKEDGDWSVMYCVVAEPGAEENGGIGAEGIVDVWKDEEEIRRAAHRFAKNKGYVNAMHGDLAQQGCTVVENAVALHDFTVGDKTIRKGSWYLGIEPSPEFRAAVDRGEITGVSLEGHGMREAVAKAAGTLRHERTIGSKGNDLFGIPGAQLPAYIQHVYNDLVQGGKPPGGTTYRLAVGIVQNWARGDDGHGHKVSADTQAKAVAAIAEWEKLKARAKADNVRKASYAGAGRCRGCSGKVATDASKCPNCGSTSIAKENDAVDDQLDAEAAEHVEDDAERVTILAKLGRLLGVAKTTSLTDEERASLTALGTVNPKTPEEDDVDPKTEQRIEAIEKTTQETTTAVNTLADLVRDLAGKVPQRKPEDDQQPEATPADVKKAVEDLSDTVIGAVQTLAKVSADVDRLMVGGTRQSGGDTPQPTPVQKTDEPWYAGIL